MDWTIPIIILQLIFLEGILSIDNAAVLGAMVAPLPDDRPIPWSKAFQHIGDALHPLLGNERTAALRVGLLGAYVGRGLMLLLASLIITNPWLKILGAAYLVRLAFENLGAMQESSDEDAELHSIKTSSFWPVVITVELTDLVFSLDNVVAAVSLSDKLWVVMLGVAIGILFMRFAAGWFSYAVEREPILKSAAYILVLNIGIELLLSEVAGIEFSDWLRFGISIGTLVLCLAYAHSKLLQRLQPVLRWLAEGLKLFKDLFDWVLEPIAVVFGLLWKGLKLLFTKKQTSTTASD